MLSGTKRRIGTLLAASTLLSGSALAGALPAHAQVASGLPCGGSYNAVMQPGAVWYQNGTLYGRAVPGTTIHFVWTSDQFNTPHDAYSAAAGADCNVPATPVSIPEPGWQHVQAQVWVGPDFTGTGQNAQLTFDLGLEWCATPAIPHSPAKTPVDSTATPAGPPLDHPHHDILRRCTGAHSGRTPQLALRPARALVDDLRKVDGDILVVGDPSRSPHRDSSARPPRPAVPRRGG